MIDKIRKKIKLIDEEIILLIAKRMTFAKLLGELKKKKRLPIVNKKLEKKLFEHLEKIAKEVGLDAKFVKKLWKKILEESIKIQTLINFP